MPTKKNSIFLAIGIALSLVSCQNNIVFVKNKNMSNAWKEKDTAIFTWNVKDTIKPYNLYFNIRNNKNYAYNNIFLIASIQNNKGYTEIDTLEYQMALPDGTLMGKGFSDVKENKLWYKENYKFKNTGNYTFKITQALRENGKKQGIEELKGIMEVGLQIENTQTK